jgi:GNAT superfamily N-acetyltransferase
VKIRRISIENVESIFDIRNSVKENFLSREEVEKLGFTPDSLRHMLLTDCIGWIILLDDYPVGFSVINKSEGKILGLFIRPDFEGKGFGKILLDRAEKYLIKKGVQEVWLCTPSDPTTRAHKFYKHLGWKESGVMSDGQIRYSKKLKL